MLHTIVITIFIHAWPIIYPNMNRLIYAYVLLLLDKNLYRNIVLWHQMVLITKHHIHSKRPVFYP